MYNDDDRESAPKLTKSKSVQSVKHKVKNLIHTKAVSKCLILFIKEEAVDPDLL
jgi:hypothetical protein